MSPTLSHALQATGLDLLQLNNWFINARVRIWRPIIISVYQQHYERLLAIAQAQVGTRCWGLNNKNCFIQNARRKILLQVNPQCPGFTLM